uniref:Ig-like domain-containing protein n=1 Tax=Paramormyrops kingsleyae TaxID=1676925 RepID=A0A3B3SSB9_9TELE
MSLLHPDKQDVSSKEGESVTLSCSYTATSDYIYLYWYRQHSNQGPQFILFKGARALNGNEHNPDKQFKSTTTRNSTQLTIPSLTIADTAIYYCAQTVAQ